MIEVVSKTVWYVTKNGETKYKYVLTDGISAFNWEALAYPVVFDTQYTSILEKHKWCINRSGFAQKDDALMHNIVLNTNRCGQVVLNAPTVHLNGYKLDNRLGNLHCVEAKGILNDRIGRIDKKPPPQELIDIGVHRLPRFVRWDHYEKKFIIQNHPTLQRDVESGLRVKPVLSGSKSSKLSIIDKYQDISIKLQELNRKCPSFDESKLNAREQLRCEYLEICNAIRRHDGKEAQFSPCTNTSLAILEEAVSSLPREKKCNEYPMPKYCTYRAATKVRGDMFVIERHPTLIIHNRTSVSTCSSKSVSIDEKYRDIMTKLQFLDDGILPS